MKHALPNLAVEDDSPLAYAMTSDEADMLDVVAGALDRGDLCLAFQPVHGAAGTLERPAFYEGLIRVFDAKGMLLPARKFIPVIEAHRMGREVDCWSLRLGLEALRDDPNLRLSVNMSARTIGYSKWRELLNVACKEEETVVERLILEITENSAMAVPELVIAFMEEMQSYGITFALDDFGAGNTALRHLKDFYFDILKIDKMFVSGIDKSADNQCLMRAIVMIAEQFEMFTVAEGIETEGELSFLRSCGVDCVQGFLTGPPIVPQKDDTELISA